MIAASRFIFTAFTETGNNHIVCNDKHHEYLHLYDSFCIAALIFCNRNHMIQSFDNSQKFKNLSKKIYL